MTNRQTDTSRRFFIVLLGLCLATIIMTSVWQRFCGHRLTVQRFEASEFGPEITNPASGATTAVGELMRKVAGNPHDKEAVLRLVESLLAIGQWESAINFAQKALTLTATNEADPRPLYLLGLAHHNGGEYAQAAELMEKSLEVKPTPAACYGLGILYLHYLNRPELAVSRLNAGINSEGLSPSLKAAMEDELAKAQEMSGAIQAPDAEPAGTQNME